MGNQRPGVGNQRPGVGNQIPGVGIPQSQRPSYQSGISCYIQPPGSYQETRSQCGSSSGCIKRVICKFFFT